MSEDRDRSAQTKADTEYLARELAALRVAIGEVATRDYLRGELERLRSDLDEIANPGSTDKPAKRSPEKGKGRSKTPAKAQPPAARRQKDPYPNLELDQSPPPPPTGVEPGAEPGAEPKNSTRAR